MRDPVPLLWLALGLAGTVGAQDARIERWIAQLDVAEHRAAAVDRLLGAGAAAVLPLCVRLEQARPPTMFRHRMHERFFVEDDPYESDGEVTSSFEVGFLDSLVLQRREDEPWFLNNDWGHHGALLTAVYTAGRLGESGGVDRGDGGSGGAGRDSLLDILGALLGHEEEQVADEAARALAAMGAAARSTLTELLADRRRGWLAASALGLTPEGREILTKAVLSGKRRTLERSIVGLSVSAADGKVPEAQAVVAHLGSSNHRLRGAAASTLVALGEVSMAPLRTLLQESPPLPIAIAVLGALGETARPAAMDLVQVLRTHRTGVTTQWAAEALARIRPSGRAASAAVGALLEALPLASGTGRWACIYALGRQGDAARKSVGVLRKIITERSGPEQVLALRALRDLGSVAHAAAADLKGLLAANVAELVRCEAVQALGGLGKAHLDTVVEFGRTNEGESLRYAAALGLAAAGKPAIPLVLELMASGDEVDTELGQGAAAQMGDVIVPHVIREFRKGGARGAVGELLAWMDWQSAEAVFELLADDDEELQRDALRVIEQMEVDFAPDNAVPRLVPLLEVAGLREQVIPLLVTWGKDAPVGVFLRLALDPDPGVREHAARGLGNLNSGDARVGRALIKLMGDRSSAVRALACDAVGYRSEYPIPGVMDELRRCLEDTSYEVRASALESMSDRGAPAAELIELASAALASDEVRTRRSGVWVMRVMGDAGEPLLPLALKLVRDEQLAYLLPWALLQVRPDLDDAATRLQLLIQDRMSYLSRPLRERAPEGEALVRVLADLEHGTPRRRKNAVYQLSLLFESGVEYRPRFHAMLGDPDPMVRRMVADRGDAFGWDHGIRDAYLAQYAVEQDENVKRELIETLAAHGDEDAVVARHFTECLGDSSKMVREAAVRGLGLTGSVAAQARDQLVALLARDEDLMGPVLVALGCGGSADQEVMKVFEDAFSATNPDIVASALAACVRPGPLRAAFADRVPGLLSHPNRVVRARALAAAWHVSWGPETLMATLEHLNDGDDEVWQHAGRRLETYIRTKRK